MTDNRFTKYLRKYAVFIFIFIFCLTFRLVTVSQKDGLFIDEPYTYVCATPNNLSPEGVVLKNNYKDYNFEYEEQDVDDDDDVYDLSGKRIPRSQMRKGEIYVIDGEKRLWNGVK